MAASASNRHPEGVPAQLPIPMPATTQRSRIAAHAFLSRYTGSTQHNYATSLGILFKWFRQYELDPLDAKRPHIELFIRQHLQEERHCSPASVNHHMTAVAGFYRFAVIDEVIPKDPCVAVRRPKAWRDPYRTDYLKAAEMRAFIAASKRSQRPSDQGLVALLAILGLRISEVLSVKIEDYQDTLDGHRVLRLVGKGAKPAILPIPVAALRMMNAAASNRDSGPLLLRENSSVRANIGAPLTYRAARIALERLGREVGLDRRVTPHMFRRGFITHGLDQGVSLRDMQIAARHSDPRSTSHYDRGALNLDRSAIHIVSASLAGGG